MPENTGSHEAGHPSADARRQAHLRERFPPADQPGTSSRPPETKINHWPWGRDSKRTSSFVYRLYEVGVDETKEEFVLRWMWFPLLILLCVFVFWFGDRSDICVCSGRGWDDDIFVGIDFPKIPDRKERKGIKEIGLCNYTWINMG